ncbi:MAG TPA: 30S ribosomal protein S2, partial [Spirochaetia bacterium]|nr:30S ribosomal protein S2 [Spirochaetia bacterium]
PGNDDAIRSISLFTQIIANAVVEAGAAEGLKIIENLAGDEAEEVKTDAAPSSEDDEVEIDPATYNAAEKAKAEEPAAEEPAAPIVDEDKLYEAK